MIQKIIVIFLGAGLLACSSVSVKHSSGTKIAVDDTYAPNEEVESIIRPYRDSMQAEMNVVIATADTNFIVERPCGNLNNWVADGILHSQIAQARLEAPTFCLLNTGGIRATLNKGNITIGDIFKIAPFDNEIVWVKMPIESLQSIADYLVKSGGEPIAGAHLNDGRLVVDGVNESTTHCWIITSDYLYNGGDNMRFFQQKLDVSFTGILMRDALIREAKQQGVLVSNAENRMDMK